MDKEKKKQGIVIVGTLLAIFLCWSYLYYDFLGLGEIWYTLNPSALDGKCDKKARDFLKEEIEMLPQGVIISEVQWEQEYNQQFQWCKEAMGRKSGSEGNL